MLPSRLISPIALLTPLPRIQPAREPPTSTYIIQARVQHSLVPVPSPAPSRAAPGAPADPAPHAVAPSPPPSAVEVQAALERGMHELDALQERCKGLLVFERDVE